MTSQVFGDVSPQLMGLVRDALQSHQLRNEPTTDAQVQSIVQQVLAAQGQAQVVPVQVTVGNPQQPALAPAPQIAAPVLARRPKRRSWLRSLKFWTVLLILAVFGLFASKTPISVVRVPSADGATGRVQAPGYTAPATGTGSAPAAQAAPTVQPTPDIGNNDPAASAPSDYQEQTKPSTRTAPGQAAAAQQSQQDKPAHTEQAPAQPEASVEGTHESGPPPPSAAEAPAPERVVVVEAAPPAPVVVEESKPAAAAPPAAASTEHTKASTKRAPGK